MTKPLTLTDTQLMLLSAASQREDLLLTAPNTLTGGAAKAVTTKLLAHGLVEEVAVSRDQPCWRLHENDQPVGIKITGAGLEAIGIEPGDNQEADASAIPQKGTSRPPVTSSEEPTVTSALRERREGTKRALVIALLSRETGASLDDLTTATGWLPHTARAALTSLRQSGYAITRTRGEDNRTIYYLAAELKSSHASAEPTEV